MILTINLDSKGRSYVLDEQKTAQYLISVTNTPVFSGKVYDELGLNSLVSLSAAQSGYNLSVFDTPAGVFTKGTKGNAEPYFFCKMQSILWEITEQQGEYEITRDGENAANIFFDGRTVKIVTEEVNQLILIIAGALIIMAERSKATTAVKPSSANTKSTAVKDRKPMPAFKLKSPKISLEEIFKGAKFSIKGKQAIALFVTMGLCLLLAVTGIVVSNANRGSRHLLNETFATVYSTEKQTEARFSVNGYYYEIALKGYHFSTGDQFRVYYTEQENGQLKSYYMSKPNVNGFVALAVVSIVLLLILILYYVFGKPIDIKALRLKAAAQLKAVKKTDDKEKPAVTQSITEMVETEKSTTAVGTNGEIVEIDLSDIDKNI